MNKTPWGQQYERRLTLINDQLCYSALAHYEFAKRIAPYAKEAPGSRSTDIFPFNPHAARLFRTADDLAQFAVHSEETTARMAIVFGYEHLAAYVHQVLKFRRDLQPSAQDAIQVDALEEQVRLRLEGWLGRTLERGYFRTAGYLRHMRNSYAHANDKPSVELGAYAATHAHALNKFWDNGFTDLGGIDFRTVIEEPLTSEVAFAFMNLCRICVREIDQLIALTLSIEALLERAIAEVWSRRPDLRPRPERIASKARGAFVNDYGGTLASETVVAAVQRFAEKTRS